MVSLDAEGQDWKDDARQPVPGEGTRPETVINDNNFFQCEDRHETLKDMYIERAPSMLRMKT